ncbi:protein MEN-8-like [Wolffia australiana]
MAGLLAGSVARGEEVEACKGQDELLKECRKYVRKGAPDVNPSQSCCDAMNAVDLTCLCKQVTPAIAGLVDIKRVCTVAKHCKVKLPPPGSKCGSEEVPEC